MKEITFILVVLFFSKVAYAQYPDGTLVFSSKKGIIGNIAKRMTGGDQYTHVGIIIDNSIYEMDFPRSKKTPLRNYKYKRRSTNDFYIPTTAFTDKEVVLMRNYAQNHLNEPYQLRNYLNPRTRRTVGTWCSPWVARVLSASRKFCIGFFCAFDPQALLAHVRNDYSFYKRVKK